jgi:O-methyltransferase
MNDARELYLDLMKRCLVNWMYGDVQELAGGDRLLGRALQGAARQFGWQLVRQVPFDREKREQGKDWPAQAHTMIGRKRLDNIQQCVEAVLRDNIPGDLIEAGVWRGGASILMRAVVKAHDVRDRVVWVADSFAGLPPPKPELYPADRGDRHHTFANLAVSQEAVRDNFDRYGLLDEQVRFLEGWFCDTLPVAPLKQIAVARLDGDMYESTIDALTHLYPKLAPGGFLIVDDYGAVPACKQAVHDYRESHQVGEPVIPIDWTGVYWRKAA